MAVDIAELFFDAVVIDRHDVILETPFSVLRLRVVSRFVEEFSVVDEELLRGRNRGGRGGITRSTAGVILILTYCIRGLSG